MILVKLLRSSWLSWFQATNNIERWSFTTCWPKAPHAHDKCHGPTQSKMSLEWLTYWVGHSHRNTLLLMWSWLNNKQSQVVFIYLLTPHSHLYKSHIINTKWWLIEFDTICNKKISKLYIDLMFRLGSQSTLNYVYFLYTWLLQLQIAPEHPLNGWRYFWTAF